MLELNGSQLKVFRTGLLSAFVGSNALEMFLREDLDKHLNAYAGREDPLPIAAFKLIEGAQAECWIDSLVVRAYQARPKNRNIADIAKAFGVAIATSDLEPVGPIQNEPPLWQELNPYRGLSALREEDANFLFGRDEDIARFITSLAENPSKLFVALGASGVGKSSLIFAGVFAALDRQSLRAGTSWPERLSQSRTWPRLRLTPGSEPLRSLAGAFVREWLEPTEAKFRDETNSWRELLLKGDSLDGLIEALDVSLLKKDASLPKKKGDKPSRYLLYIDQGEELYTRGGREPNHDHTKKETQAQKEARRFSELVAEAARHPRLVVIMSARSDFLGRLQADTPLQTVKQQIDIAPVTPAGLEEVVKRPAAALDVTFEPGLDDALIEATREQAGALPLLSDTLDVLWKEMQARGDGVLRWSRPLKEGVDVALKLGERADGFVRAHQEQEAMIRRLFCVRLAHVPLQGAATRRTALLQELTDPERALVAELAGFEQRILVTGERDGKATAEVAHEALFTAWQSLRNWIASRRAFYAWATQIEADRQDYEKQGALLTGRPLERAKSFLETDGDDVPAAQRAFVEQSLAAEAALRHAEAKRERARQAEALALAEARAEAAMRSEDAAKAVAAAEHKRAEALKLVAETLRKTTRRTAVGLAFTTIALTVAVVFAFIAQEQGKVAKQQTRVAQDLSTAAHTQRDLALRRDSELLTGLADRELATQNTVEAALVVLEALPDALSSSVISQIRPPWPRAYGVLNMALSQTRERLIIADNAAPISSVAFSPDGRRVLTGSSNTAKLWDTDTGVEVQTFKGHIGVVSSVAFNRDGTRILTGSVDNTAILWDTRTGAQLMLFGHLAPVSSVAFNHDGTRVLTASEDNTARMWDAHAGSQLIVFEHTSAVRSIAFSHDGTRIVTGSADNTGRLWNAATGAWLMTLDRHNADVSSVAFSSDDAQIVTGSHDETAKLWNARTGELLMTLSGHAKAVRSVAFSPDSARIVTGSEDKTAKVWDIKRGGDVITLSGHAAPILSVAFSHDGTRIVSGSGDNTARLWDVTIPTQLMNFSGHSAPILSIAFNYDGTRIVTGSADNTAKLWDVKTGAQLMTLDRHTGYVTSVAVSHDSTRVLTGSADNTAKLWDSRTGAQLMVFDGHTGYVSSVAYSRDGTRIVTGSSDKTAKLWDVDKGAELLTFEGHIGFVSSVAYSPDGTRIATGSSDKTAKLWDAKTGALVNTLDRHNARVWSVAFSPDGAYILTGSEDRTAKLWNAKSGAELMTLDHHTASVSSVAFSPDSTRIVTGSSDNTAKLWDVKSGDKLISFNGHTSSVYGVAFSPQGRHVLSGSADKTAKLWDVDTGQSLIKSAKERLPRCLTIRQRKEYFLPPEVPDWCYDMKKWPYQNGRNAPPAADAK